MFQWVTNFAAVHDVLIYGLAYILSLTFGDPISLISGVLARLGYIDAFIAGASIIFGKLTGDVILYWLGRHWGEGFVLRYGRHFGITEASVGLAKKIFGRYHEVILLGSKLTNGLGIGFSIPILFTAGLTRVSFGKYMAINVFGEVIWTSIMVYVGFFFSDLYITIDNILGRASLIGGAIIATALLFGLARTIRRRLDRISQP